MSATNPVTTEIIRNAFISMAEDMNAALMRSAYSPIIYEGGDCSTALLDENARVVGQAAGLPVFLGSLSTCVEVVAERCGWDFFGEGDVILLNDSYIAGTHLNDVTVIMPIFWQGQRVGFASTRAHWMDVGGKDVGFIVDSTEIYQEGLRLGPTKVYEGGKARKDILDILERNSRFGDALLGDLHAQIAAGKTGEARLCALLDRFGLETVRAARDDYFSQSERLEREAVRAIPDGVYSAEGCMDNDGHSDEPVTVKITVTVKDDKVTVDMAGSSPQTLGSLNCGMVQTISTVRAAFKNLISADRPVDGGTFTTLDVLAPEGSIFNAQEPAACTYYFSTMGLVIDLFVKAFESVLSAQVAAAHCGDVLLVTLNGYDETRGGQLYVAVDAHTGGWGGWSGGDGQDCLMPHIAGNARDYPIEVFETRCPIRVSRYGILPDSGGAGAYRGGSGCYREYEILSDSYTNIWAERTKTPAWGIDGGADAKPATVRITTPGNTDTEVLKANQKALPVGSVLYVASGGGGGYGDPQARDPELVRADVDNRFISAETARNVYGVEC